MNFNQDSYCARAHTHARAHIHTRARMRSIVWWYNQDLRFVVPPREPHLPLTPAREVQQEEKSELQTESISD